MTQPLTLDDVVQEAYSCALDKGFWTERQSWPFNVRVTVAAALIATEASEIIEAVRHRELQDDIAAEIADVVIRAADLAGFLGIDLDDAVRRKMTFNRTRPYLNGKAF
jgi:NTP pyrophosphatase (non-canonical NTP hydrolase)